MFLKFSLSGLGADFTNTFKRSFSNMQAFRDLLGKAHAAEEEEKLCPGCPQKEGAGM